MVLNGDNAIQFPDPDAVQAPEGTLDFAPVSPGNTVPTNAVPNRAAKIDYTLGSASPGIPSISAELQNNGDARLTQILRDRQRQEFEQRKADMVNRMIQTQRGPVTNDQADFVRNMTAQDFHDVYTSKTPMETAYARKYVQDIAQKNSQVYAPAEIQHPEAANAILDTYQDGVTRNEITHKAIDDIQSQKEAQGWGSTIGDFIASSLPLASMRLLNVAQVPGGTSIDPGKSIQEQVSYLHSLPPDQFQEKLKSTLDSIPNLDQRLQFANAVLKFSDSDSAGMTAMAIADAAGIAEGVVKTTSRGVAKAAETAPTDVPRPTTDVSIPGPGSRVSPEPASADFFTNTVNDTTTKAPANQNIADGLPRGYDTVAANDNTTGTSQIISRRFNPVASNDNTAGEFERLHSLMAGALEASKEPTVDLGKTLEKTGDFQTASSIDQIKLQAGQLPDEDIIRKNTMSINNPDSFFRGDSYLGREASDRLRKVAEANTDLISKVFDDLKVDRDTPTNQLSAYNELFDRFVRNQNGPIQSGVLDLKGGMKYYDIEKNPLTNTETMHVAVGLPNGELFPNRLSAQKYLDDNMNFTDSTAKVVPKGGKYYIQVSQDVPDAINSPELLNFEPHERFSEDTKNGILKGFLGAARNQKNVLGEGNAQARLNVAHGGSRLFEIYRDILDPLAKLKGQDLKELMHVMESNRDFVDIRTGDRGRFYQTQNDFEQAFYDKWSKMPSERQTAAYFANVQANDLHYMVKAASEYRDKVRVGLKGWEDTYTIKNADGSRVRVPLKFEGKDIDNLPYSDRDYNFAVAYPDPITGELQVRRKNYLGPAERKTIEDIKNRGGRIIQVSDQKLEVSTGKGDQYIGFYVSENPTEGRVSMDSSYRPGGHVINEYDHYIKQPIIKNNVYIGDLSVRSVQSRRLAEKLAQDWETARQMMLRNDPKLNDFVSRNLGEGMDEAAFRSEFSDKRTRNGVQPGLDPNQPFVYTGKGQRVGQNIKLGSEIIDTQNNPYNLLKDIDRTFAGERDSYNIPAYYEENGTRKIHKDGKLLDPMQTLKMAASNIVDRRLRQDYITKSANQWVHQFQDILEQPADQLMRDTRGNLLNPQFKKGVDAVDLNNAMNSRNSIIRFAGMSGKEEATFDSLKARMGDWIYAKTGRNPENVPNWLLPFADNPAAVARSVGFHAKLGLFNPIQLPLQMQTLANVIALSPGAGLKSAMMGLPIRLALINPKMLSHSSGVAKAFGWKSGNFEEMMNGLLKSGWHDIHGTYGTLDDIANPNLFTSSFGKVLDAGTMFFNEGERMNRMVSFATSYLEWKAKNPAAELDNRALTRLMSRADDLTTNMSAANNAVWQKGLMAIPAQFQSYNLRLMEQYMGKGLTTFEKMQLFATHSLLFGVPTAAGGAFGVWPIYQSVKKMLIDKNIPHDDDVSQAFLNGLPQLALKTFTGLDENIGERYGTGGTSIFSDYLSGKNGLGETLMGSSGSILGDIYSSTMPALHAVWDLASGNPNGVYPLDKQTLLLPLTSISSANNAYKLWYAMNYHKWISRHGSEIDNVTDGEAAFSALTGANPQRIQDMYMVRDIQRGYNDAKNHALTVAADYMNRASKLQSGDPQRDEYLRMAKANIVLSGGNLFDVQKMMSRALAGHGVTQMDSTMRQFELDVAKRKTAQGLLK